MTLVDTADCIVFEEVVETVLDGFEGELDLAG